MFPGQVPRLNTPTFGDVSKIDFQKLLASPKTRVDLGIKEMDLIIPALAVTCPECRADLLKWAIKAPATKSAEFIKVILNATCSTEELMSLVNSIPVSRLNSKDLQSIYVLSRALESFAHIKPLCQEKRKVVLGRGLTSALAQTLEELTKVAIVANRILSPDRLRSFAWILSTVIKAQNHLSETRAPTWLTFDRSKVLLKKAEIFLNYGIIFADGNVKTRKNWSLAELEQLEPVLEKIPVWALLSTPRLGQIIRHKKSECGFIACRAKNGDIEVFESAFDRSYDGNSYLTDWSDAQVVLCHELGHAMHFGDRYTMECSMDGRIVSSGNPVIDFPTFSDLSDWRLIRKNPKITRQGQYAILGKVEIELNTAMQISEFQRVQFSHDPFAPRFKPLWAHNPDAGFAFGPNAHRSPWEDWADSACLYFLEPHSLKRLAANKFEYFDNIFRSYQSGIPIESATVSASRDPKILKKILKHQGGTI